MERAAGFTHDDTPQSKLDKLDALLAQSFTPREDATLFADMLSLPNDGRYPTLQLVPKQRRQKTLTAPHATLSAFAVQAAADDFRGRALDRPDEPGSAQRDRGPDKKPSGVARCYLPIRVRAAMDRATTLRHSPSIVSVIGKSQPWSTVLSAISRCLRASSGDCGAHGWHSAVHRGNDEGGAGSRW